MLTSVERINNLLAHKPTDRIGLYEHYWSDTRNAWAKDGKLPIDENPAERFGYDIDESWPFNVTADLDFVPVVIAETEDTITTKNGNGATLRTHKKHDTTPEHVAFEVCDADTWQAYKEKLTFSPRRVNYEGYAKVKRECAEKNRFFTCSGVAAFEMMHPLCGHENLLVGMALDPDWVLDMSKTYTDLYLAMMEDLFSKEGKPDGIWFYEDMGYKQHPFMSPTMYRELLMPDHKRLFDYAHSLGCKVILHSCGFVEPLVPGLVEAGIDCLQAIEVKAGMDLLRLYRSFGERLSFMGGLDVRTLFTGERDVIDRELESKIPTVMGNNGFILHSDHSIPATVDFDTYEYFVNRGLELGTYK